MLVLNGTDDPLVLYKGGGHTWPGGSQYLGVRLVGRASRDLNASRAILGFFLVHPKHPKPRPPG